MISAGKQDGVASSGPHNNKNHNSIYKGDYHMPWGRITDSRGNRVDAYYCKMWGGDWEAHLRYNEYVKARGITPEEALRRLESKVQREGSRTGPAMIRLRQELR